MNGLENNNLQPLVEQWFKILEESGFCDISSIRNAAVTPYDFHCYLKAKYNDIYCFIKCRCGFESMEKEFKALEFVYKINPDYFPQPVMYKKCPRKIRDKEQSDMNEFLECHIEKVSSDGSKARGSNCDTRLELSGNREFMAIEYIDGEVLSQDLLEQSSLEKQIKIFNSIYDISQILFENNIIHRDFNCDNLIVTPDGTTKLFDFQHALGKDLPEDELNLKNPKRLRGTNKHLRPAPFTWDDMYSAYNILKMFDGIKIPEYSIKMQHIKNKTGKLCNYFLKNNFPLCAYKNYKCFVFYKIYGLFQKQRT